MSVLTKKEREALEEVFLSINNQNQKFKKVKCFLHLILNINIKNIDKKSKTEYFRDIFNNFFHFFTKLKKNLSK